MTEIPDTLGDMAQAAITARALEPSAGSHAPVADSGHTHESACLNCGTPLLGSHCHGCGQAAHVHKTLGAFFHDLLHGVFHFEGKIWRTLPMLAWHPGRLTREYVDGRRASYVSPMALFLFVVFVTFAAIHAVGDPIHFGGKNSGVTATSVAEAARDADARVAAIERELAQAEARGERTAGIEGKLSGAIAARDALKDVDAAGVSDIKAEIGGKPAPQLAARIEETWAKLKANPDLALYKLQSSAYKYSWLLIPLSVPFLWLLFPFSRRFGLYDHTVFVTYSLSFMFLLLTALSLLSAWGSWGATGVLVAALLGYAPFHMYRQLRETYALGRFGAWWRTWALSLFAVIVLMFWALALLAMQMGG